MAYRDGAQNGIEASDLASLLCRFEEATSSADDSDVWTQISRDILDQTRISGIIPAAGSQEVDVTVAPQNIFSEALPSIHSHEPLRITPSFENIVEKPTEPMPVAECNNNCSTAAKLSSNVENCEYNQVQTQSKDVCDFKIICEMDHNYFSCSGLQTISGKTTCECSAETLKCLRIALCSSTEQKKKAVALVSDTSESYQGLHEMELVNDMSSSHLSVSNSQSLEECIEENQVFVDSDGNDLYDHFGSEPSEIIKCNCSLDQHVGTHQASEKKENRKRLHSYHQHAEFSTSPIREDTSVFFDKIPSYYTALSIPSKPVTTTVFASAAKTIGSTDHLDLLDASDLTDEGHYDKVPAHRRCFTNTTKEIELKFENPEDSSSVKDTIQKYSPRHQQELSNDEILSSDCRLNSSKPSDSDVPQRRSRSITRHTSTRFLRRSTSSLSNCSTCSSHSNSSGCSTCSRTSGSGSSCDSERGSSACSDCWRSRSRSPGSTGYNDNRYPSKRTRNSRTRSGESGLRSKSCDDKNRHHSLLDQRMSDKRKAKDEEKLKAMEERRVVYVGKIPDGYTKKQLYHQFKSFGEIKEVKVNFREHGDNYGFITFAYASDAVAAKEKGNSIPGVVKFDLCFGGRRHFCPDQYADLDGNREIEEEYAPMPRNSTDELDYAALLKQHSNQQKKKRTT